MVRHVSYGGIRGITYELHQVNDRGKVEDAYSPVFIVSTETTIMRIMHVREEPRTRSKESLYGL